MLSPNMPGNFNDHFSARSADYARFRPTYPPELVKWLASVAPSRGLALDCGCGTGQLSTLLAQAFDRVVAIDASPAQIANATRHDGVQYRVGPCEQSGLDDASVDLVAAAQAAHWFDLKAFFGEVRRVLRPHGCIALITYGITETTGEPGRLLANFYSSVVGPYWPPERRHVETGYRLLPFPFDEVTAPEMTMTARWTVDELLGYVDTWSAVRQAEAVLGRSRYALFVDQMRTAWGDPRGQHEIRWPLSMRVGLNGPADPSKRPMPRGSP